MRPGASGRPGLAVIADTGYVSRELDGYLADRGVVLHPAYCNRVPRAGEHLLKPIRQLIGSVYDTGNWAPRPGARS